MTDLTDQIPVNLRALEIARTWIGTPYKHQARLKGAGCDCIGLVIGVWIELYGKVPDGFKIPPYTASWAEETKRELMVEIGINYLIPIPLTEMLPGDVVMYRMLREGVTKHAGILSEMGDDGWPNKIIHAYAPHAVMESPAINSRNASLTHAFRFPEDPKL